MTAAFLVYPVVLIYILDWPLWVRVLTVFGLWILVALADGLEWKGFSDRSTFSDRFRNTLTSPFLCPLHAGALVFALMESVWFGVGAALGGWLLLAGWGSLRGSSPSPKEEEPEEGNG